MGDDVDPLNRSLQRIEMLSHLALLDHAVDTKSVTYEWLSFLAGSSQVHSSMRADPLLRAMHPVM